MGLEGREVTHRMWSPLVVLSLAILLVDGVSIKDLRAPNSIKEGDELILDCDFTYNQDETEELVVKWFHNSSPSPFTQWVPSMSMGPQIIDKAWNHSIDLGYRVEGSDQFTQYRALRIPSVTREHGGDYRCQVSSFSMEATMEKTVTVYVPPTSMVVSSSTTEDTVTISCSSEGVFPDPLLSLSWTQQSVPHSSPLPLSTSETDSLYSSSLSLSLPLDSVSRADRAVCQLSLPGTQFLRTEETPLIQDHIPEKFLAMFGEREGSSPDSVSMEDATDYDTVGEEPDSHLERVPSPMEHVVFLPSGCVPLSCSLPLLLLLFLLLPAPLLLTL